MFNNNLLFYNSFFTLKAVFLMATFLFLSGCQTNYSYKNQDEFSSYFGDNVYSFHMEYFQNNGVYEVSQLPDIHNEMKSNGFDDLGVSSTIWYLRDKNSSIKNGTTIREEFDKRMALQQERERAFQAAQLDNEGDGYYKLYYGVTYGNKCRQGDPEPCVEISKEQLTNICQDINGRTLTKGYIDPIDTMLFYRTELQQLYSNAGRSSIVSSQTFLMDKATTSIYGDPRDSNSCVLNVNFRGYVNGNSVDQNAFCYVSELARKSGKFYVTACSQ